MCYVEGNICIVSVDFLNIKYSNTQWRLAGLPKDIKPLGHTDSDQTGSNQIAYIAPLRYRGNDARYGQLMVNNSGDISVWVSQGGDTESYYYGQLVFPVTRS